MCAHEMRGAALQDAAKSDEEAFRAQLRRTSQFFDRLVDMIPAKHYVDDGREDANSLKFLKKSAKLEAKQQRKEAAKKRKRDNLDPDKQQSTLDIQRQQALRRKVQQGDEEDAAAGAEASAGAFPQETTAPSDLRFDVPTGADPSADELRQKLHERIEVMRKQRKAADEKKQRAKAAKEWRDKASGRAKSNSLPKGDKKAAAAGEKAGLKQADKGGAKQAEQQGIPNKADAKLSFGRIEVEKGHRPGRKDARKGKPEKSKAELLEAAKQRQEQLKALEGTREGRLTVEQDAWNAALARARGERILHDPKLLSRSLKKEEKQQKKKAAAWKERKGLQIKDQKMKQKKRNEALKTRAEGKIQKRKDKREKKLMRAGFEGRRDTPLGT